jgi:hypothetical protein
MEIKGKVHCLFEQSGTFKNEFIKLGIPAEDYDIQNNFGQTDHVTDLFAEIESEYRQQATGNRQQATVFSGIDQEKDLMLAFFPCIYFETIQQLYFCLSKNEMQKKPKAEQIDYAIDRLEKRTELHKLLYKLAWLAYKMEFRLVVENPATPPNYLITGQNFPPPTIIDRNRMLRGDVFRKPTAYWFFNCEPTHGFTLQHDKEQKKIQDCHRSNGDGLCSEERSMIHPDYARNWICDFILGKTQDINQLSFDFMECQ